MKVICFLFDSHVGGPHMRVRHVYGRLMQQGYQVRVAVPAGPGGAAAFFEEAGIPADELPIAKPALPRRPLAFSRFVLRAPIALFRLIRFLKREQPALVHVNGAFDLLPALAARMCRVPVVWHLNDTVFPPGPSRRLGRLVRAWATLVVVAARRVALHYGVDESDCVVVPAPVDPEQFPARDHPQQPGTPARLTLLGNWNWIKGQDRFVEVLRRLHQAGRPVNAVIAGRFLDSQTAYWQPIMENIRRRGLDQIIATPGFVEHPRCLLEDSTILLLTSRSEASPINVLEAMAVGVPVVAFDVGGVADMLAPDGPQAAGIVVPEGDVQAMVEAIDQLLDAPDRYQAMARNGPVRARGEFGVDCCVQRHRQVYAEALSRHERVPA